MKLRAHAARSLPARQAGSYLLEALIAMLIFAFGVLGLIGLLGSSIRVTNDARYRSEAANLAERDDRRHVDDDGRTDGHAVRRRRHEAQGVAGEGRGPAAVGRGQSADGRPDAARPVVRKPDVVVTVFWQMPGETELHQHLMTAQIGKNPDRCHERTTVHNLRPAERGVGLIEIMVSIVIGDAAGARDLPGLRGQRRPEAHDHRRQRRPAERELRPVRAGPRSRAWRATASRRRRPTARQPGAGRLRAAAPDSGRSSTAGATDSDPDTITVLYGGSSSLSTPVQFKQTATTAQPYVVPGPSASARTT